MVSGTNATTVDAPKPLILESFLWGLLSAVSLNIGSIIGVTCLPRQKIRAILMSFGGGALLFALSIELFGHALHVSEKEGDTSTVWLMEGSACAGGLLFALLNRFLNSQGADVRKPSTTKGRFARLRALLWRRLARRLRKLQFFNVLSLAEVRDLVESAMYKERFSPGEVIMSHETRDGSIYFIVSGLVRLHVDQDAQACASWAIREASKCSPSRNHAILGSATPALEPVPSPKAKTISESPREGGEAMKKVVLGAYKSLFTKVSSVASGVASRKVIPSRGKEAAGDEGATARVCDTWNLGPDKIFGDMAVLTEGSLLNATAVALTATKVLVMPSREVARLLDESEKVRLNVVLRSVQRLIEAVALQVASLRIVPESSLLVLASACTLTRFHTGQVVFSGCVTRHTALLCVVLGSVEVTLSDKSRHVRHGHSWLCVENVLGVDSEHYTAVALEPSSVIQLQREDLDMAFEAALAVDNPRDEELMQATIVSARGSSKVRTVHAAPVAVSGVGATATSTVDDLTVPTPAFFAWSAVPGEVVAIPRAGGDDGYAGRSAEPVTALVSPVSSSGVSSCAIGRCETEDSASTRLLCRGSGGNMGEVEVDSDVEAELLSIGRDLGWADQAEDDDDPAVAPAVAIDTQRNQHNERLSSRLSAHLSHFERLSGAPFPLVEKKKACDTVNKSATDFGCIVTDQDLCERERVRTSRGSDVSAAMRVSSGGGERLSQQPLDDWLVDPLSPVPSPSTRKQLCGLNSTEVFEIPVGHQVCEGAGLAERDGSGSAVCEMGAEGQGATHGGHGGAGGSGHAAIMVWLGILIDCMPESLVIGILINKSASSEQTTASAALPFVMGVFLSNLPESMSSSGSMKAHGMRVSTILLMWLTITIITAVGACAGALLFPPGSSDDYTTRMIVSAVEGLAAGAMLTMIAQTMMPEAFEQGGDVVGLSCLAGFLCALSMKLVPLGGL